MAGNIPFVGFHDFLCVFASGHRAQVKLSTKDEVLMKYVFGIMTEIEPEVSEYVEVVDRLEDFDGVIATGSNNTSRYFEYYFGKYPNIIRIYGRQSQNQFIHGIFSGKCLNILLGFRYNLFASPVLLVHEKRKKAF